MTSKGERLGWVVLCSLVVVACAEELPGVPPPDDQLHYPMGIASFGDVLLVVNSNFDQRYSSGSVMAFSIAKWVDAVSRGGSSSVVVARELPDVADRVRIPSFGGEIVMGGGGADAARFYVSCRGSDQIVLVRVDDKNAITCTQRDAGVVLGTDCSPAHLVTTTLDDPFALAYVQTDSPTGVLAVGHLPPRVAANTVVELLDVSQFDERIAREARGEVMRADAEMSVASATTSGSTGIAFLSGADPRLLSAGGDGVPVIMSARVDLRDGRHAVFSTRSDEDLRQLVTASGMRGLAHFGDGKRVLASLRFRERSTTASVQSEPIVYNSGVALFERDGSSLFLRSIVRVGEELSRLTVLERTVAGVVQRLVYAPDLRSGKIWILDATSDVLHVAGVMDGFVGESQDQAGPWTEILRTPYAVHFPRGATGSGFGFVSNFGNSTMAVIDVRATDPKAHRVVGRFGRALSPDGVEEVP